jgi:hypothetical protein
MKITIKVTSNKSQHNLFPYEIYKYYETFNY